MGISAGGSCVLQAFNPYIKRILVINPVIHIKVNKLLDAIKKTTTEVVILFGTLDPSYPNMPLLKMHHSKSVLIKTIEGADHFFSKHHDLFINLPETYLFKK